MSAFLIEAFDWSVDMAVNSFIAARTPGSTFLKLKIQICFEFTKKKLKIMTCALEIEKYILDVRNYQKKMNINVKAFLLSF